MAFVHADGAVHSQAFDLLTAAPEELMRELAQRVTKRLDDTLKGSSEADPIKLGNPGHRARLYEQRFGASPGVAPPVPLAEPCACCGLAGIGTVAYSQQHTAHKELFLQNST